jgi:hypothetical protein
MIWEHILWWLLTIACVVWYCTITVYVAIKGASDIKQMLSHLGRSSDDTSSSSGDRPRQEHHPQP